MAVSTEKNENSVVARLADRLGKLFDLCGEIHPMEQGLFRDAFHGPGFVLSFPSSQGMGVFVIADPERTLPRWYRNPGIAGRSRLFLLASQMGSLFSEEPCETSAGFFSSLDYFAGAVADLDQVWEQLSFDGENVRAFQILRDDGHVYLGWILGPVPSAEVLHQLADTENIPRPDGKILKPLRSLEERETPLLYSTTAELEDLFEEKKQEITFHDEEIHELAQITVFHTKPAIREPKRNNGKPLRERPRIPRQSGDGIQEWVSDVVERIPLPGITESVATPIQPHDLLEENVYTTVTETLDTSETSGTLETDAKLEALVEKVCEDYDFDAMDAEKVLKLPVVLSVLAGRSRVALRKLLDLRPGDVLELGRPVDTPLEILVEQHCVGTGNAVEYDNRVGIQVCEP